jgi:uncharacterized paraquat-inducible protein A
MKLTEQEQQERNYLEGLKASRTIPMMQKDQNRLRYLNAKEFDNCCSNPHCTGYEGKDEETTCPKCQSKLVKSI